MPKKYNFRIGDVVIDTLTKEIGLLVERYDVLAPYWAEHQTEMETGEEPPSIWAWEILWSGSKTEVNKQGRKGAYTEMGLSGLISEGEFELLNNYSTKGSQNEP